MMKTNSTKAVFAAALLLAVLFIGGCTANNGSNDTANNTTNVTNNQTPQNNSNGTPRPSDMTVLCTDPRPEVCTEEYSPVCGLVQVQCIRAPCPPINETFPNACQACANKLTISYTQRACDTE